MIEHLNSFSASGGGNLIRNFPKIQMPRGLPEGGCWSFDFTNTLVVNWSWIVDRHTNFKVSRSFRPAPKITTFGRSDCPIIGLVLVFYFQPYRDELRIYTTTFVSRELSRVLNRPSSLVPLFQNETKCETILMKVTLICMKIFPRRLVLIQRQKASRKWPISRSEIHQGTGASFKILTNR